MTPDDFANMTPKFYAAADRIKARNAARRTECLTVPMQWPPPDRTVRLWRRGDFECAVARGPMALCGYVRVPEGHRFDGVWYDLVQAGEDGIGVGLTFCQKAEGGGTWFGFDVGHLDDWVAVGGVEHPGRIWTEDDVAAEVERLADRLMGVAG